MRYFAIPKMHTIAQKSEFVNTPLQSPPQLTEGNLRRIIEQSLLILVTMIDHLGLPVRDMDKSRAFFLATLQPLGYEVIMDFGQAVGLGANKKPDLWLSQGEPGKRLHLAFAAPDKTTVDACHAAALAAGGEDNGAPGPRPQYHEGYYGAFVIDPDGNNIEVVCHTA